MMNEFIQKYLNSLTGRVNIEEKKSICSLPLKDMIENLIKISDADWGKYAFSREPLNGKINEEARANLIIKANKCGIEYAENLIEQYGNITPQEVAIKFKIKVDYPSKPVGGGHVLFAQFVEPNEISIFMDCIVKANELLRDKNMASALSDLNVEKTLLAHEIFHYLEEVNKDKIFTRQEKVRLWAPKPFRNESTLICLGEIAGMAFAKRLLNIPYSPYILDVVLTYAYNQEAAYSLYEEIMLVTSTKQVL